MELRNRGRVIATVSFESTNQVSTTGPQPPRRERFENMLLDIGEKVHVVERRMFESDVRRHFFGTVERVEQSAIRVAGYAFMYDSGSSAYLRGAELRTRVIPLGAAGLVINIAPPDTIVDEVRYVETNGRLVATDGGAFHLDINEFGRSR